MELKKQAIDEINKLGPAELAIVYDCIQFIKKGKETVRSSEKRQSYLRSQEILKKCKGALTEDIIEGREERL